MSLRVRIAGTDDSNHSSGCQPGIPLIAGVGVAGGRMGRPIIQVRNLEKTYQTARGSAHPLPGTGLRGVRRANWSRLWANRATGKSTLLHILGALDAPTAGTVHCASTNVTALSQREASAFRNREIGYVWQFHYLLPEFSALENVAMPLLARGIAKRGSACTSHLIGSGRSIWKIAASTVRESFQAGSSSGLRWPGLWLAIRGFCWPTNQPAIWTRRQPGEFLSFWNDCT